MPESTTLPGSVAATFSVRDTIAEMCWTGGDRGRAEETFHAYLATRKRRRRPRALRPLATTRRRPRAAGLVESASLPAAPDDDGSLATSQTLRSAVF